MKITLPLLSLVLLAFSVADARPGSWNGGKRDEAAKKLVQKRQTTRDEIANRAHIKDTVKRVHNVIDMEVKQKRDAGNYDKGRYLVARQAGNSPVKRDFIPARTAGAMDERAPAPAPTPEPVPAPAAGEPVQKKRRSLKEQEAELEKKAEPPMAMLNMRPRGQYPKCDKSAGAKTGYAHYPGWQLTGDDLSGGIPVTPESACVQACNKYGGACSGIFFDSNLKRCYLKGVHTTAWDFEAVNVGQSTDLVGGCALWANVVPPEMDAVCCRN